MKRNGRRCLKKAQFGLFLSHAIPNVYEFRHIYEQELN
jgi:hypothetical protein